MTEKAIAELMAAGEMRKAELVELAGGLYMPSYVGAILKIPEQLVDERRKAGELIAVETQEGYRYPACQFTPDGVVTGLSEDLAVMSIRADWMRLEWLLVPDDALEGISPLEALRAGRLEHVIDIARDHEGPDPGRVLSTEETPGDITALLADDLASLDHGAPRAVENGPRPLDRPLGAPRNGVHFHKGSGLGPLVSLEEGAALLDEITVDDDSTDWAASELLAADRIAEKLGISIARLERWRDSGTVIAFRKDAHGFVYPVRQFDHSRPIEGLDRVAGYFPSPEEAWEWLVTPNPYTDSAAPIDRLRSGHSEEVIRAVEGAHDYQ
ncbi:antitoxin Xre/MbcA/ParS-like domain-containing protein [Microvirga yunnanensis]|uniref:antitoxin Xre/MbcA/ParS-like domain-containing protein n=1 Tax=Microvirga yunnanensis TaxID=2953740 RepID=UPI0021CAB638|nr:hypothetical protein [Microvirga sp. HBU65207]